MIIDNVIDSIVSPQTTHQPIQLEVLRAAVVLGYSGGNSWPTWAPFAQARPDLAREHRVIPVTLSCDQFGHMYDIEDHGGSNRNIGVFMHNAVKVWKTPELWGLPWLYTFASNVAAMIEAARSFGYEQGRDYYILAAHPNSKFGRHICSPEGCGFPKSDGTQYLFAGGYDESIINDYMLHGGAPAPAPTPKPAAEVLDMIASEMSDGGTLHVWWVMPDKRTVRYRYQSSGQTGWTDGGVFTKTDKDLSGIAAARSKTGVLELFASYSDGNVSHTWQQPNSTQWSGGEPNKQIAAFTPLPGN